jgi:hypothetical protein
MALLLGGKGESPRIVFLFVLKRGINSFAFYIFFFRKNYRICEYLR